MTERCYVFNVQQNNRRATFKMLLIHKDIANDARLFA